MLAVSSRTVVKHTRLLMIPVGVVGILTAIALDQVGVNQKWQVGAATSLVVFGCIILEFWPLRLKSWYWSLLAKVAVIHSLALWLIIQVLLKHINMIPLPLSAIIGVAECVYIALVVAQARRTHPR